MTTYSPDQQPTPGERAIPIQNANPTGMECGAAISRGEMAQFVAAFQQSARRWEFVVYPALFAFIVLAGYGFFLVYSLTSNMALIARSIDPQMQVHMEAMAGNIAQLNQQIQVMSQTMNDISGKLDNLSYMRAEIEDMQESMASLEQSVRGITASTDQMRWDVNSMNRNVSKPMNFFNNYMPW